VLADNDRILLQSLKELLQRQGFQVVGEASDGKNAIRLIDELHPNLAILDITMPIVNGLGAAREVRKTSPETQIIALTAHEEDQYILEALKAGIRGYVLKSQSVSELVQAIREVARGMIYLSPRVWSAVVEAYLAKADLSSDPLTSRERQVLQLMAEGETTKEIATTLQVSTKTVEFHRYRIMEKLNIHSIAGLVRYAIRCGLVPP
jgi:DNA-binding NarL/FixJ family response regulator